MNAEYLPIADIRLDGGTQARECICEDTVADYAEALADGETLPPAVAFLVDGQYYLADGFHRYHATYRAGATTLECEVRTGTLQSARLFAYGANKTHGLRRSNADKRKAVSGMLAEFADWSDSRIAKHVGVDHKTVAAHRPAILGNSQDAPFERTVERNGRTYTQDVRGQKKSGQERARKPPPQMDAPNHYPASTVRAAVNVRPEVPPAKPATQSVAPAADDPHDMQIRALEAQIADYKEALEAELAENDRIGTVLDADDRVSEAMAVNKELAAENKRLNAMVAHLCERINGLVGESTQQVRRIKAMQAKMKKAGLE